MNSIITKNTTTTNDVNVSINVSDLSIQTLPLFLNQCKYTKAHAFTQSQLSLLNNIPIDILEHNIHITINEAEIKHAKLITSLNTLLNTSFTLSEIYQHYIILTRTQYTVINFVNCLIIIDAVLTRFSDFDSCSYTNNNHNNGSDTSLFKLNINDIMLSEVLSFFQIENTNTYNVFNDVYKNTVFTNSIIDKIVIMIVSVNMGGVFKCDDFTYDTFVNNICLYNRVYYSHATFAVFVHLCFVVYCNLYLLNINNCNSYNYNYNNSGSSNNNKVKTDNKQNIRMVLLNAQKLSRNNGNIYDNVCDTNVKSISLFKKRKSYNGTAITMRLPKTSNSTSKNNMSSMRNNSNNNNNSIRSLYLNEQCYLLDNDIISFPYTEIISALMFQSYLKLYLFAHISYKKIKCTINLTIQNPIILLKSTLNPLLLTTSHLFTSLDPLFKDLSLSKIPFITKQSLTSAFKSISFKHLSFNFIAFNTVEQIHMKLNMYDVLFQKTTSLHIQEPIDIVDASSINGVACKSSATTHDDNYMNIEMMFLQWKILNYLIDLINKNKDIKSSKKIISFVFKFNCFKFSLNKQTKDIMLYFNYSFIKEKSLFVSFKKVQNVLMFINNLTDIISNVLTSFKNYKIALRLFPNTFRSQQLLFYINVILKYITTFIYDNSNNNNNKNITLYDTTYNNMSCFIKETNDIKKRKLTLMKFKNSFKHPHCNRFKFIFNYINHIIEIFDYVVLCDKEDSFILLRTFDDNKIFFVIKPHNSISDKDIPHTHLDNSNSYISVRVYVNNKRESYEHALNFIEMLNKDKSIQEELNVTFICDKAFLETNVLVESKQHKKVSKKFYQYIDDIYMISKTSSTTTINNGNHSQHDNSSNDYYNYDIFIADNFIAVSNFHKYNVNNDIRYNTLIYEFISILSSCIDLILLILKKKDIYIPRFIYIVHTHHNKCFSFEYKMSNIFIKKLNNFTSLFNYNTKRSLPLVCLLSQKQKSQYTISNDNFYDVFMRLFLNLHKVADMQTHLNEAFFHKIHKNIFLDYYDAFIPVCFGFDSYVHFNMFFNCNNYTTLITKGEKFKQGYIIPMYTSLSDTSEYNYKYIVNSNSSNNVSLCRDVIVFMFKKDTVFDKNAASWLFSFNKVSFFIDKISKFYMRNERSHIMKNMYVLSKRIKHKHILHNIFELTYKCNNYGMFNLTETTLNEIIKEFILEKERIKTQKVRLRVFQLTDKRNKYKNDITNEINLNNNNNNCILF